MSTPLHWIATVALFLVGAAIAGGAFTALMRLTDRNMPVDTGLLHGGAGIAATLLLAAAGGSAVPLALLAIVIAFGVALYFIIRRKGALPKSVILLHAAFAAGAMHALLSALRA